MTRINLAKLTLGIMTVDKNVNAVYEYLRVLSTRQVNPLIIPPDTLWKVLAKVKKDMNRNHTWHRAGITFHKLWARTTTQKELFTYGRTECNPANGARNCKGHGHRELQNQTLQEVLAESCH